MARATRATSQATDVSRRSRRLHSEQPSTAPEVDAAVTVKQRAPRKKGARSKSSWAQILSALNLLPAQDQVVDAS